MAESLCCSPEIITTNVNKLYSDTKYKVFFLSNNVYLLIKKIYPDSNMGEG